MRNAAIIGTLAALTATAAYSGPRTSANYSVAADTMDGGGGRRSCALPKCGAQKRMHRIFRALLLSSKY